MAPPEKANFLRAEYAKQAQQPMAGFQMAQADPSLLGDDEFDGLYGKVSQKNGLCMAASGRSLDLALARMDWALTLMADEEAKKERKKKRAKHDAKEDKDADEKRLQKQLQMALTLRSKEVPPPKGKKKK